MKRDFFLIGVSIVIIIVTICLLWAVEQEALLLFVIMFVLLFVLILGVPEIYWFDCFEDGNKNPRVPKRIIRKMLRMQSLQWAVQDWFRENLDERMEMASFAWNDIRTAVSHRGKKIGKNIFVESWPHPFGPFQQGRLYIKFGKEKYLTVDFFV